MTPTEVAAILRQFNEWRRSDYEPSEQPAPPDPREIGEAIDSAIEMIDRLEATEKERDELRDKIEAMEKQVPVAWQAVGGTIWGHKTSQDDRPLYALPGAKGE